MSMIETPHVVALIKDNPSCVRFLRALTAINDGLEAKKIWNAELQDAKFALSNGIGAALNLIFDRWHEARPKNWQHEDWQQDFSMFCSFNQAAGRVKRLAKKAPREGAQVLFVKQYVECLKEIDAIWKGIQELKPYIVKGRKPTQTKTEAQIAAELVDTGICAICGHRQKFDAADKMVYHGYQMSGYNHSGYRVGKCFGVGYRPYELSNEACVAYAPLLKDYEKGTRGKLRHYKSGDVQELSVTRTKWVNHRSEEYEVVLRPHGVTKQEFEAELARRIDAATRELRDIREDIKTNQAKIDGWSLQPLRYGKSV